jgi:5'-3' exonuclease
MKTTHLIIDAKNMLYRAIYSARSDQNFKSSGHHPINIVLHILTYYREKFQPEQIHVFWDSPRDHTWRRKETIVQGLVDLTEISTMLFSNMGIRQYYRSLMEADDLIYAFCKLNPQEPSVIVSSDSDLNQIPFHFSNVSVYHPTKKKDTVEPRPKHDPIPRKCLIGDKSDNIFGYHRVGKVTAGRLTEDTEKLHEFFLSEKAIVQDYDSGQQVVVGPRRFLENLQLIDLSLCPHLLDNLGYVLSKQFKPVKFDLKNVRNLISKYKLRGVTADIPRYISPFKKLVRESNAS